jgi:type II secretory pathway pseudopilin PulG
MVEMIVVLVLVSILAGMGMMGWKRLMWRVQAYGATDELRNALLLARSDAVTRKRHSGILIDRDSLRYLRFVDSSPTGASDGRYTAGETILQPWTPLPKRMIVYSMISSITPDPTPRPCGTRPSSGATSSQTGRYSIVFKPDGRSWAPLLAKLGVSSFPSDTFRILVLPPTGLVQMEN